MQWGRCSPKTKTVWNSLRKALVAVFHSFLTSHCYLWKKEGDDKNGLRRGALRGVLWVHILPLIGLGPQMRAFAGATCSSLYGSERLQIQCCASV